MAQLALCLLHRYELGLVGDCQVVLYFEYSEHLSGANASHLFVGLILNALFGWWWADSIAAILMVPIITREGIEAFKGDTCDACH